MLGKFTVIMNCDNTVAQYVIYNLLFCIHTSGVIYLMHMHTIFTCILIYTYNLHIHTINRSICTQVTKFEIVVILDINIIGQ